MGLIRASLPLTSQSYVYPSLEKVSGTEVVYVSVFVRKDKAGVKVPTCHRSAEETRLKEGEFKANLGYTAQHRLQNRKASYVFSWVLLRE